MDTSFPWTTRRAGRRQVLSALGLGLLSAVALVVALVVARESPPRAVYPLAVAVTFGAVLRYGWVSHVAPQNRPADARLVERDGRPGTQLRYSGTQWRLLLVVTSVPAVVLAVGAVDLAVTRPTGDGMGASVLPALGALLFGWFLLAVARGRIVRGEIVLDRAGIRQRGRAGEVFLPWTAVTAVAAVQAGPAPHLLIGCSPAGALERRWTTWFWRIDRRLDEPVLDIDCTLLALDQDAVRAFLTHYVEHPEDRAELGTSASLGRLPGLGR
ncbi:hypothetical protein ACIB24_22560 [Spongisporangium articulatum]|uniref:PH domain-containing protein n=1 Tax=Spongisporangium articulatum TaxID=3362603 RepID=A0ABW8AUU8_9ACTN